MVCATTSTRLCRGAFVFARKRAMAAAGAMAALALAVAACRSSSSSGGGTRSANNTRTIAWAQSPDSLDPALTAEQDVAPVDANIFDTLTWLTPAGAVTPDLATSWSVSSNGETYTFHLRSGVNSRAAPRSTPRAVSPNTAYTRAKSTRSPVALGLLGPSLSATAVSQDL